MLRLRNKQSKLKQTGATKHGKLPKADNQEPQQKATRLPPKKLPQPHPMRYGIS
jgi:hypothetical protein